MRRGLDVDVPRQRRIVVHNHLFPRDLGVLEHQHAVGFIESRGERMIEGAHAWPVERLTRPQREARQVQWNNAGDGFLELVRRERHYIADQHLVSVGRSACQHLHAVERDALVVLGGDPERRLRQSLGQVVVLVARALRRNDRISREQVVAPHVLVDRQQIVLVAARLAVEHFGLHRKPGQIAREGVGRSPHQAKAEIRDLAVRPVAAAEVLLRARLQVVHAVALTAFLESHDVAESGIGLHIEQRGIGACTAGEGRMRRLIRNTLLAEIDDPAITDALQIFLAGHQHGRNLPRQGPSRIATTNFRQNTILPRNARRRKSAFAIGRAARRNHQDPEACVPIRFHFPSCISMM